jgi:hypothetical protein
MDYKSYLSKLKVLSLAESQDKGFSEDELNGIARKLYDEYTTLGYIRETPSKMVELPTYSFILFLEMLASHKGWNIESPVQNKNNTSWITKSSISFMNVRAVGSKDRKHGDFVNATKVLPCFRVEAIHLSPFFDHALGVLYAPEDLSTISDDFVNEYYSIALSPKDQLKFFIKTCHLLGKVVGFDLLSNTAQFSRIALTYPEYFRWLKFEKVNGEVRLADGKTQEEQLKPEYQKKIHEQVRQIVKSVLKKYGLKSLLDSRTETIRTAHLEIIHNMIENFIWTIPSHTWNGVGLPEFSHYVADKNYPEFRYINMKGEDHRDHAFGMLTPYKFYDNLPINSFPKDDNLPILDRKVLRFFSSIFLNIRKEYEFDFIRWDYTDHVFDSVYKNNPNIPVSDRITPFVIKKTIQRVQKKYLNVGMFFERMGTDIKNYYKVFADVLLGDDIWFDLSKKYVLKTLKLSKYIQKFNSKRNRKITVAYAIDTHDTGNPLINRTPLIREGEEGVILRMFLSRFGSAGDGFRPKYECIGTQDGSLGLFEANISTKILDWADNRRINNAYHNIEDVFESNKNLILNGTIEFIKSKGKVVYWKISDSRESIVCVVNTSKRKIYFRLPDELKNFNRAINPFTKVESEITDIMEIGKFGAFILR